MAAGVAWMPLASGRARSRKLAAMLKRALLVIGGLFVLYANNGEGPPGTALGFYPPVSSGTIGFDLAKAAIAGVALWAIYRGIRPRASKPQAVAK